MDYSWFSPGRNGFEFRQGYIEVPVCIAGEDAILSVDTSDYDAYANLCYTKTEDDESYFNRVYKYLRKHGFPLARIA